MDVGSVSKRMEREETADVEPTRMYLRRVSQGLPQNAKSTFTMLLALLHPPVSFFSANRVFSNT
jgi:hypothetical protein